MAGREPTIKARVMTVAYMINDTDRVTEIRKGRGDAYWRTPNGFELGVNK